MIKYLTKCKEDESAEKVIDKYRHRIIQYYNKVFIMEFITRKKASKIFNVSERTLDRWIEGGILKAHKFGKSRNSSVRIETAEIRKFLAKNKK